jgi:hypothetical protein
MIGPMSATLWADALPPDGPLPAAYELRQPSDGVSI